MTIKKKRNAKLFILQLLINSNKSFSQLFNDCYRKDLSDHGLHPSAKKAVLKFRIHRRLVNDIGQTPVPV